MKHNLLAYLLIVLVTAVSVPALAGDYVIGEGDGLDVSVWGVKDLNVSVKVRPDGKITIPGLGDVKASGFVPKDLQVDIAKRLKELVKNPIVTVTVKEITNSKVYIFGGGVPSGIFDLNRRTTLLQLLCMIGHNPPPASTTGTAASGPPRAADYRKAYVLRNGKRVKEDFYKLYVTGDTNDDFMIESNDSIFIPPLVDRNVYVLGAVNAPKAIEYRDGMTVMEAILESGGFTKFAKQNDTVIHRKDGSRDLMLEVRAKDLVNDGDLGQNLKLKAGDYIIVKEGMF
ncbi:XrtA/PEP-CTERM system exopolysaccharide export protein [Geobacter pickeringii]|uniref:Sugar ABC transporter substrate-binding protein n=1 Tax=Geobacter pickeringii TaxID=345632 RepID=A0A0B5BHH5_9BACT|nr:XrtA/PEP-CTERM system exopolysaccharide export protein [Geobacter pickeringii]AJE03486.1 sugar ABC transporter substrate-binding protein [Geobacter pickeringii]